MLTTLVRVRGLGYFSQHPELALVVLLIIVAVVLYFGRRGR